MGTYVQSIILIKTPTEQELQKIIATIARGKQTCETELKITRPYWNTSKHTCFFKKKLNIFLKKAIQNHQTCCKNWIRTPYSPFLEPDGPQDPKMHLKKQVESLFGPPFWRPKPIKIDEKSINIFDTFFGRPFERLCHRFGSILPPCSSSFWITFPKQRFYEK